MIMRNVPKEIITIEVCSNAVRTIYDDKNIFIPLTEEECKVLGLSEQLSSPCLHIWVKQ